MKIVILLLINSGLLCAMQESVLLHKFLPLDIQQYLLRFLVDDYTTVCALARLNQAHHTFIHKPAHLKIIITMLAQKKNREIFQIAESMPHMPGTAHEIIKQWINHRKQIWLLEEELMDHCEKNNTQKVQELLVKIPDLDVNRKNKYKETCLMQAAFSNNVMCIQKLLAHGADKLAVNANGETAVFFASDPICIALLKSKDEKTR